MDRCAGNVRYLLRDRLSLARPSVTESQQSPLATCGYAALRAARAFIAFPRMAFNCAAVSFRFGFTTSIGPAFFPRTAAHLFRLASAIALRPAGERRRVALAGPDFLKLD